MRARRAAIIASLLFVAACATTPIERARLPFESPTIEIAPGAPYERCVRLEEGDRLYFSYRVDPPMSFAIRRQSGTATVSFVVRDASRDDAGIFFVPETQDYCLHWEPSIADAPWPTLLRFEIRLNTAP
jgi:hypothetical protein